MPHPLACFAPGRFILQFSLYVGAHEQRTDQSQKMAKNLDTREPPDCLLLKQELRTHRQLITGASLVIGPYTRALSLNNNF